MMKILLPTCSVLLFLGHTLSAQLTFTDQSNLLTTTNVQSSHPCAVADMNGDRLDDIIRLDDGVDLYINYQNNDGSFTEFHYGDIENGGWGGDAWGMCIGDVDNNGRCDILAGGSYDDLKIITAGDADGVYTLTEIPVTGIFLQGVNFFDIDYDGYLDIFACHDDGPSQLLKNDGAGNFSEDMFGAIFDTQLYPGEEQNAGNYGSVWSDVNGDRHADCYITKCRQGVNDPTDVRRINQLWLYNADNGTYSENAEAAGIDSGWQGWSSDFADIDNDGDMDVFIGNHDYTNQLFENVGNGIFVDISDASGIEDVFSSIVIQSIFRDFDNDGYIDILITGGSEYSIAMNNGDNTFTAAGNVFGNFGMNSFACGDLNNDGFVDVYGSAGGYGSFGPNDDDAVYMNDGNGNGFVKINLESTVSAPNGVGAIVVVETSMGTQMREIRSGESYGIQNSMIAHFGIGLSVLPLVTVYWPSGIVDQVAVYENITTTIVEGNYPVSVQNLEDAPAVSVFPNPASSAIQVKSPGSGIARIQLFDGLGKIVRDESFSGGMTLIERGNLEAGVYELRVTSEDGSSSISRVIFN